MNYFLLDEGIKKNFKNSYEIKMNIKNQFYNYEPKLKYNQTLHWSGALNKHDSENFNKSFNEQNKGFTESIGKYDSYKKKLNPRIEDMSKFDLESKIMIPTIKTKKNLDVNNYFYTPHSDDKLKGLFAEPPACTNQRSRSLGFNNPIENYFAYMSDEKQQPNHIVLPFPRGGYDTRHLNKLYRENN